LNLSVSVIRISDSIFCLHGVEATTAKNVESRGGAKEGLKFS
jgi:hypothetical protein